MRIPAMLRPALESYADRLRSVFGDRLREIRLFGSYARGDANEDSDVDVLVVVDDLSDLEIGVVATEAAPIILSHHIDLSPLPMSTNHLDELRRSERLLARTLDEEGVRL